MQSVMLSSYAPKKDRLEDVESHSKEFEIYRFSRFATQNFFCRQTMVADSFKDFEPPSKKSLSTPHLQI